MRKTFLTIGLFTVVSISLFAYDISYLGNGDQDEFSDYVFAMEKDWKVDGIKLSKKISEEQIYVVFDFVSEIKDEYNIDSGDVFVIYSDWHLLIVYFDESLPIGYTYGLFVATKKSFHQLLNF
ncbi:hypothetical protein AGMMS49944_26870 [Spirochaetia bacterium]|nr:hypothetical protein AGMMS49944_26870 [Spirochaetia bacterium]